MIGNGNVALDVARMLAKHADDLLLDRDPGQRLRRASRPRRSPTCTSSAAAARPR